MKIKIFAAVLLAGATFGLGAAQAQTAAPAMAADATATQNLSLSDLAALRAELKSGKKQITAETLKLTDAEATKFWPIYDQYAAELSKLRDVRYGLVVEYVNTFGKYTDAGAMNYIKRWLDADVNEDKLRAKYVPIVGKVLPGIKAATFFQIDRRLNMVINLKMASQLPILQLQADLPK